MQRPMRGLRGASATEAFRAIRELIVNGSLAAGARLVETDLSERLGLSRTPVRAALQRLREEGYVREKGGQRQSRLFVSPLSTEDASELYYLLGELDGMAAHFAAALPAASRQALTARLRALNGRLREAAGDGHPDGEVYFTLDADFHRTYHEAADRPRIQAFLKAIRPQAERYVRAYTDAFASAEIPRSAAEHDRIVEAIERGDPEAAHEAARVNYRNAALRLWRVIGGG
ncbi:MAG TPA: GntR family transcriptional regulator [Longimicrobiales bacterium]|nr:GntR family transcriptional regulator [Longimicrobiales bacterium]